MMVRSVVWWLIVTALLYHVCSAKRPRGMGKKSKGKTPTASDSPTESQSTTSVSQSHTSPSSASQERTTSTPAQEATTTDQLEISTTSGSSASTTMNSTSGNTQSTISATEENGIETVATIHASSHSNAATPGTNTPSTQELQGNISADHNTSATMSTTEPTGISKEAKTGIVVSGVIFGLLLFTVCIILTIAICMVAGSRKKANTPPGLNNIHAMDNPTYKVEEAQIDNVQSSKVTCPQANDSTQHIYHILEGPTPVEKQPATQHVYETVCCDIDVESSVPQPQGNTTSRLSIYSERVVPAQKLEQKRHDYEPVSNFRNSKANYDHLEPQESTESDRDTTPTVNNIHQIGRIDPTNFKPNYDSLERRTEKSVSLVIVGDYAQLEGPVHDYAILHPHISSAKGLEAKRLSYGPTPDGEYSHLIHC